MRKQYDRVTKQICFLVLIIAILCIVIFTYKKIDRFNLANVTSYKIDDELEKYRWAHSDISLEEEIIHFYQSTDYSDELFWLFDNGYGDVYFDDGKTSVRIGMTPFALLEKELDGEEAEKLHRYTKVVSIILFESKESELYKLLNDELRDEEWDELRDEEWHDEWSYNVLNDGVFARGGKICKYGTEYEIPRLDSVFGENLIFGELSEINDSGIDDDVRTYVGDNLDVYIPQLSFSKKAKSIHEKIWESDGDDNIPKIKRGILTSYYSFERELFNYTGANTVKIRVTQVFHPLEEVFSDNKYFYIKFILIVGLALFFIHFARELYYNAKTSKKLMSSSLVRSCSYSLKEPFRLLNDSVGNWLGTSEESRKEYSDEIVAEVDRMDDVIKNILKYKDLNQKKIEPRYEIINLYYFTQNIYKQLETYLTEKNIRVTISAEHPEKCSVWADLEMLKIIIKNLIFIATEYTKEYMDIRIELMSEKTVMLSIYTKGVEISWDDVKNMWIMESRSTKIEDKVYDNSGVSMVVAVLMMQAQNVKYGCNPVANGSRFWIELRSADEFYRFEKDEER